MELKFDKNNLLKVRLAIVESQLKFANDQIKKINNKDLKIAIPPFIVATLIALAVIYFLEKRIPMVPLIGGILITLFGGLTLYFDN